MLTVASDLSANDSTTDYQSVDAGLVYYADPSERQARKAHRPHASSSSASAVPNHSPSEQEQMFTDHTTTPQSKTLSILKLVVQADTMCTDKRWQEQWYTVMI